jgi:hypothetical protein
VDVAVLAIEVQQTPAVKGICPSTDEQTCSGADQREDRAGKEKSSPGCRRQKSDSGIGGDGWINLAGTT